MLFDQLSVDASRLFQHPVLGEGGHSRCRGVWADVASAPSHALLDDGGSFISGVLALQFGARNVAVQIFKELGSQFFLHNFKADLLQVAAVAYVRLQEAE